MNSFQQFCTTQQLEDRELRIPDITIRQRADLDRR